MIAFSQWFFEKDKGPPIGIGRIEDPDGNREEKGEGQG